MIIPHDQLMKELIARFADQFLRLVAPEVAGGVDLETLRLEPEEHANPTGHARRSDLVGRTKVLEPEDREDEVLVHVEIELQFRKTIEPRLLRYHRGLSLKYELPVHTLVLFLRGGPAGVQVRLYQERSLGTVVSTLSYRSLGLSQAPAEDFLQRPEPLAWAFAALMKPRKGQIRSQLGLECVSRIAQARELERDERGLLLRCVLTYADFEEGEAEKFATIIAGLDDEEVQDVGMTMTELWKKQGLESGLEQGLEQGKQQGRAEGARALMIQLLVQKFGALSSDVETRINALKTPDEIQRLAERMFQAESLEDLGLA
ncbi:MAG: DUF4351 domain-containing protein [Acidobacteriota bacterium]